MAIDMTNHDRQFLEWIFSHIVIILAFLGVFINIWAFFRLHRRKPSQRTHFHKMLSFLSVFDLLVSLGGGLTYGLPFVWPYYQEVIFPFVAPTLAALVHIFLLTSVFTTVVISLERYIRICYLCQMRTVDLFSAAESRLRYILVGLVIIPTLFYIPKFFEYTLQSSKIYFTQKLNCSNFFPLAQENQWSMNDLEPSLDLKDCLNHVSTLEP